MLVVASYGAKIPDEIIDLFPPRHAINIHPSLLPEYRGPAPIQWAIANGETETGITILELSKDKFDRGDILMQEKHVRTCRLLVLCRRRLMVGSSPSLETHTLLT